jgi:hypothetical protein
MYHSLRFQILIQIKHLRSVIQAWVTFNERRWVNFDDRRSHLGPLDDAGPPLVAEAATPSRLLARTGHHVRRLFGVVLRLVPFPRDSRRQDRNRVQSTYTPLNYPCYPARDYSWRNAPRQVERQGSSNRGRRT